jgi:hypothetical protein
MTFNTLWRRAALGAAVALFLPAALGAQAALPPAAEVIARYVDAAGGRDALLATATSRVRGTFEMPAAGMRGALEVLSAPHRALTRVELPGIGAVLSGYDGTVGWSINPMMGARLVEGAELAALVDQANPLAAIRDASLFTAMETLEATEVAGQPCYLLRLVWRSGRETRECYSVETGLAIAAFATSDSPMGSIETRTLLENYGEFGGARIPTRMVVEVMGQQQIMTIDSVEFELDEAEFALPPQIRQLVEQQG